MSRSSHRGHVLERRERKRGMNLAIKSLKATKAGFHENLNYTFT